MIIFDKGLVLPNIDQFISFLFFMAGFTRPSEEAVLERELLESGAPEWADCILTEKQFCKRYGAVLESSSQEGEED